MVNLTRIYTKTGDDGTTSLGDMSRTSKNDPRLEAYATVDEANSYIGVVLTVPNLHEDVRKLLVRVQNDLFDVGADLCTPVVDSPEYEPLRVLESQVSYLEEQIDKYNAEVLCAPIRYSSLGSSSCRKNRCAPRRTSYLASDTRLRRRCKQVDRKVSEPTLRLTLRFS